MLDSLDDGALRLLASNHTKIYKFHDRRPGSGVRPIAMESPLPGTPPLPLLHLLFDHWTSLQASGRLPPPSAFDILEVPKLFGHLHLVDVIGTPPRFRFRLFGTTIAEIGGRDLTGRWVDEIVPAAWSQDVHAAFLEPIRLRRPCYSVWELDHAYKHAVLHRLACPMSSDGRGVDRLIVGIEAIPRAR